MTLFGFPMIMNAQHKVLLTTGGLGNRLGELTKFTNKSLIRVGKKPAISYIIEKYSEDVEIVVTLGHYENQVRDFLGLVYPTRKFTFVTVEKYEGLGSSLLYSMLSAKEYLQCPFIFHSCDTITFDPIPLPNHNWCAGFKNENNSQYRTHTVSGANLVKINEKGGSHFDRVHIGLCGIHDYKTFWKEAEKLYGSNPNDSQWSDCHVINEMLFKNSPFQSLTFSSWLDIGNMSALERSREEIPDKFHLLDKVDESIFIFDTFVVKFFFNTETINNRVARAKSLEGIVPKITGVKPNFYRYDYVDGVPLSTTINTVKFRKLLVWATTNVWEQLEPSDAAYERCRDFYFKKSEARIKKFLTDSGIKDTTQIINGIVVPPALEMLKSIPPDVLCNREMVRFHGDFILENIIDTGKDFSLIDWRQDFGGSLVGGDVYYDLAKLNHNLIFNHNLVNKGLFEIEVREDRINCDILTSSLMNECQTILHEFLLSKNLSQYKVDLLTPIIWLNMSPLHEYPINTFLFYFGKYKLARALNL